MERQKSRLRSNYDAAQHDFDSLVKKLSQKLQSTGKLVNAAVNETESKKFKKANEAAKRNQQALEDTLDKIAG